MQRIFDLPGEFFPAIRKIVWEIYSRELFFVPWCLGGEAHASAWGVDGSGRIGYLLSQCPSLDQGAHSSSAL